ncbi:iron complex transport system permease protein [Paenibacillus cellulosilyticus]|uniref:Iron complex transport system permease protein n=1 Tax=Paenibacillus cellulosilyticus TaxID=375489 RepID=A0A2V2YVP1_9BACL|nr:iron ABC transporter permease [Paenibacillus cellulosilyticus]PWW03285.1 iron complex transport system permease protein [Paenibacillus cellulosilyticus]QKS43763.1 iron ABC transporter permease [Paenibacillus cellulosilyticus]
MNMKQRRRRRQVIMILAPVSVIISALLGIMIGAVPIALPDIWHALTSPVQSPTDTIVFDLRLPRVLIGLLTGACLAVSGAILQGVMRNPLADPGVIGVSSGAGLAAVITMVILPQFSYLLPAAAFAGAFISSIIIYFLSWDRGASPVKIVLAGIALNALLGAVMNGIMVMYSDRIQSVLPWLSGGLNGRSWHHLSFMLPYALVGLIVSILAIKPANLLLLGDNSAKLLGQKVELQRLLLILLSSLLAGTAVSVAGLIGFVGLVVPHAVRLLIGDDYRYLLPVSMLGGAALVTLADTAARTVFDPVELPVGILLACLGAPFFLYLLKNRSNWR